VKRIHIIGGGLAGPEAALQAAHLGCQVTLSEMRPLRSTEAHQTPDFAELVCSNSLKSETEHSAPWLLKQEMRRAGSFLLAAADASAVPAGHALAVDRTEFSRRVAQLIDQNPNITVRREEITHLHETDPNTVTILASGPLTSAPLAQELQRLTGADHLAFYDSISPLVDASTIDMDNVYYAARWDRGTADYINCPFTSQRGFAGHARSLQRPDELHREQLQLAGGVVCQAEWLSGRPPRFVEGRSARSVCQKNRRLDEGEQHALGQHGDLHHDG
jgi:methylenetetrahydrofolate--tRNA-(uracil-5-)-methyltransferase